MKQLAAILCLGAVAASASAQGLINFANNPQTLVSAPVNGQIAAISGPSGSYYFALLTSPSGAAGSFAATGLYATNSGVAVGRFSGGNGIAVNGWAPGTTMFYEVAGWANSLGSTFNQAWLAAPPSDGLFGVSEVGSGVAGGGPQSLPTLQLFGGTGITQGWLLGTPIPEPPTATLAGCGAATLLISRRQRVKRTKKTRTAE